MNSYIQFLFYALVFFFGLCVGAKMGSEATKKAYGQIHPRVFVVGIK